MGSMGSMGSCSMVPWVLPVPCSMGFTGSMFMFYNVTASLCGNLSMCAHWSYTYNQRIQGFGGCMLEVDQTLIQDMNLWQNRIGT